MNLSLRAAGAFVLLLILVYCGDYVWVRLRLDHPKWGPALGTVQMEQLYAIPLKSGKTAYELDAQQPVVITPCVHSLFPHMGNRPCWYLQRQSQKPIPMAIMAAGRP